MSRARSLIALLIPSLTLATACGDGGNGGKDGDSTVCAAGTELVDGTCVPEITDCGAGTVAADGECVPDDQICAPGSTYVDGECLPDLACGDGTERQGGICVPIDLGSPDVEESPSYEGEVTITPPAGNDTLTLGGTIDTPIDVDGDGYAEADWDTFVFTGQRGMYLRIFATSDGATLPAVKITSRDEDETGWPLYQRYGFNQNGPDTVREVYLPHTGEYALQVTDYNHLIHEMLGEPALPVGGEEFTYWVEIENLGPPEPAGEPPLPISDTGDFEAGGLRFYRLDGLPHSRAVTLQSLGKPQEEAWSDVFPILLLFGGDGTLLAERIAVDLDETLELALMTDGQDYLVVQDYWATIGPEKSFRFEARMPEVQYCVSTDCSTGAIAEGAEAFLRWDLAPGDFFVASIYLPDVEADVALSVTFYDDGMEPMGGDQVAYGPVNVFGFDYAEEASFVYAWLRGWDSMAVPSYAVETTSIATPQLLAGEDYTGLHVWEMPPYTLHDSGIEHIVGTAGQILFFYELTTQGGTWVEPNEFIMTADLEEIGPVIDTLAWNFPDGDITPPFAYLPKDGHYLHWVNDPAGDVVNGTYDVKVRLEEPDDLGTPAVGTSVSKTTVGLGGGLSFFTYTGAADQWANIAVTPNAFSNLQPEVWVFNFGRPYFDWIYWVWAADPASPQMGMVGGVESPAPGEGATLDYVSPYDGTSVILVMDKGGSAGFFDTFNIVVEVAPPPDNDVCAAAETVTVTGGAGIVEQSLEGATNSIDELGCLDYSGYGPDRFYRVELAEGAVITATLTADWPKRLYLISDCGSGTPSCVAGADQSPYAVTHEVPSGGGGPYVIGVDSGGFTPSLVEAAGVFTLDITVLE